MMTSTRACISCGGRNHRLHFEAFGHPILECSGCGLAFTGTDGKHEAAADFYRHDYYALASAYGDSLRKKATARDPDHEERVCTVCQLVRRRSGKVLEVGCASGALLAAFRKAGWRCIGIEPSREMADLARASAECEILEATLETSRLPPRHFDVVAALHVLEHSPDPRRFIDCCFRLLKENGVLLVEVPDFGSRQARAQGKEWLPLYPDTHFYHFTARSLSGLLERRGFRVVRIRRYGGLGTIAATRLKGGQSPARPDTPAPRTHDLIGSLELWLFANRHLLSFPPHLRQFLRFMFWQILGMNDSLRVFAIRAT
jgi:SAM-dependent methyltransferase